MNIVDNKERNKRICELRGQLSAALIAERFGITRNAVIGVWGRAGLSIPVEDGKLHPKRSVPQCRQRPFSSPQERAEAVAYANKHGLEAAARKFGRHANTIYLWRRAAA